MIDLIPLAGLVALALLRRHEAVAFKASEVLNCLFLRAGAMLGWAAVLVVFFPVRISESPLMPLWCHVAAGLEDVLFVLPALILPRPWRYGFLAFSTLVFMSGHLYQGDFPALAKLPFVPLSYILAARFGILTTVAAHSLNDIGCWAVLKIIGAASVQ